MGSVDLLGAELAGRAHRACGWGRVRGGSFQEACTRYALQSCLLQTATTRDSPTSATTGAAGRGGSALSVSSARLLDPSIIRGHAHVHAGCWTDRVEIHLCMDRFTAPTRKADPSSHPSTIRPPQENGSAVAVVGIGPPAAATDGAERAWTAARRPAAPAAPRARAGLCRDGARRGVGQDAGELHAPDQPEVVVVLLLERLLRPLLPT